MAKFIFTATSIDGVYVIEPTVFGDDRGYNIETYNEREFRSAGLDYTFVQDNQSRSKKGVLRGLHFQKTYPQAKLVRVLEGAVLDVAVDLRKGSKTYGKWVSALLSADNKKMLMVPRGFAHGFVVQSEFATFAYKLDDFYHPEDEGGIIWNDPDIAVDWGDVKDVILSDKDRKHPTLAQSKMEFDL